MSYILDALKKSEKERSLENVPTLKSVSESHEKRIPMRWFLITVATLVAGLIALFSWIIWFSKPEQNTANMSSDRSETASLPSADSPLTPDLESKKSANSEARISVEQASPVLMSELEPALQARIPALSVNVLSYSEDSSKRFVMIDQNIFKEGEVVKAGVVVDEIRNADVIFRFEDVRFILQP